MPQRARALRVAPIFGPRYVAKLVRSTAATACTWLLAILRKLTATWHTWAFQQSPKPPSDPLGTANEKAKSRQISNLVEPVTDSSTNGLSQIVYHLTQELADLGHDVTLYAPRGSPTNARLIPLSSISNASDTILGKVLPVAAAFADCLESLVHE
jgi:hypothetical protein